MEDGFRKIVKIRSFPSLEIIKQANSPLIDGMLRQGFLFGQKTTEDLPTLKFFAFPLLSPIMVPKGRKL